MSSIQLMLAGFGGQGILFAGKIVAQVGLIQDNHVSWLPSYGPEMRGGTANCSVCVDSKPIGSPIVLNPQTLIVMNKPSYDKFIDKVVASGKVIVDETLVQVEHLRKDIEIFSIPATKLANDNNLHGLANIIMLGQFLKVTCFTTYDIVVQAITNCIPPSKKHLIEPNIKALALGYEY